MRREKTGNASGKTFVSIERQVGLLAHDQPIGVRPRTLIPRETAEFMLKCLVIERISRKLYRFLPPKSVFCAGRAERLVGSYIPPKLPPREIEGVRFVGPKPRNTGAPRSRFLPRFREIYGDDQLRRSLA
jgi:hypothetical protein